MQILHSATIKTVYLLAFTILCTIAAWVAWSVLTTVPDNTSPGIRLLAIISVIFVVSMIGLYAKTPVRTVVQDDMLRTYGLLGRRSMRLDAISSVQVIGSHDLPKFISGVSRLLGPGGVTVDLLQLTDHRGGTLLLQLGSLSKENRLIFSHLIIAELAARQTTQTPQARQLLLYWARP